MQAEGLWGDRVPKKVMEPEKMKTHWDFLLEEMAWMANDFKEERIWKEKIAKQLVKSVVKHHQSQQTKEKKKVKDEEINLRKLASQMGKSVKKFWAQVEQLVRYKHQSKVDQKRKKVMEMKQDLLVTQTEKFSSMLSKEMQFDVN